MTSWTAHVPARAAGLSEAAERLVVVKEGFSWPAFFVAPLWLVATRMWLVLALWIAFAIGLGLAADWLGGAAEWVLPLLGASLFALEASDLRRWTLARRGFSLAGIVEARSKGDAEAAFLRQWAASEVAAASRPPYPPYPPGAVPRGSRSATTPVVGLFPEPERRS